MQMKTTILSVFIVLLLFSTVACKKSKEARQIEKYLSNSQWEFYYAEDAQGNDITDQVLADSAICLCFNFLEDDKDPVTFNTIVSKCRNMYFDNYKGYWGVLDWVKLEKKAKGVPFGSRWKSHHLAIGNLGLETKNASSYLRQIDFYTKIDDEVMISKRYKLEFSGLPSDSLMEIRYYKKI
jgi:hypothetical protein